MLEQLRASSTTTSRTNISTLFDSCLMPCPPKQTLIQRSSSWIDSTADRKRYNINKNLHGTAYNINQPEAPYNTRD